MGKLEESIGSLKYGADGLIPAVCVDAATRQVLMVAYVNEQALLETVRTGRTHFWSRSRRKMWIKGQTSGHTQEVKAVYVDCDMDSVVVEVAQRGAACHDGHYSCFYRRLNEKGEWQTVAEKVFDPKKVYGDEG